MKRYENCIRCGRKLRTDASQELGFGKVCWEKWNSETNAKTLFEMEIKDANTKSYDSSFNASSLSNNDAE